jgi:hypothetical protein
MRPISTQAVFRFSYAVSLYVGALKACEDGKAAISQVGLPTFLLIGFSLECVCGLSDRQRASYAQRFQKTRP